MTTAEFVSHLKNVRVRGANTIAECPAHPDQNPSLSICDGERGVLVKCWAGCSLQGICNALGLNPKDLFYGALDTDPQKRYEAALLRELKKQQREQAVAELGRLLDTCKRAEQFIASRPTNISDWSDDQLDRELNAVADALAVLQGDPYAHVAH